MKLKSLEGRLTSGTEGAGVYIATHDTAKERSRALAWIQERANDSDHPTAIWHEGHHYGETCTRQCQIIPPNKEPRNA